MANATKNSTKKSTANSTELLSQFESEIIASTQLPFCQIQNPPNLSLAQIEEFKPDWGWFIPAEQAESAGFNVTEDWTPTRLTFGNDANGRTVDGFLTKHLRIVVLHRSNIEVQEKAQNGWKYCGLAYQNGQATSYRELAASDRENFRLRTRYLILFLDKNNQLLHSTPIKLGMNSGVGAAFGNELKEFRKEIETVFFTQLGKPQQELSDRAHALTVLDFQLGLQKSEGKAPYLYPQVRLTPNEKTSHVTRRERPVKLVNQAITDLIIPKASDVGQTILSLWEEYKGFPTKYQDDTATLEEPPLSEEPPF